MKLKLRKPARQRKEEREVAIPKKDHDKIEVPPHALTATEEYIRLPIPQCESQPEVVMRLDCDDEDIEGLADSIRANGQQVPGLAVEKPDHSGFWIFAGNRRLRACKLLYQKYGEPSTYKALLFHGLTKEEIYCKAIIENESERGERKNLSVVEELAFLFSIRETLGNETVVRIGVRAGKNEQSVRRRLLLAEELGGGPVLKKLFKIEKRSETWFKLSHLEALSKYAYNQELLLQIAAVAAGGRLNPEEVDPKAAPSLLKYTAASWFYDIFPELKSSSSSVSESSQQQPGEQKKTSQTAAGEAVVIKNNPFQRQVQSDNDLEEDGNKVPGLQGEEEQQNDGETSEAVAVNSTVSNNDAKMSKISIVAQGAYFAECPYCETENPFQTSGLVNIERKVELVFYNLCKKTRGEEGESVGMASPEKMTVSPTIVLVASTECSMCFTPFWVSVCPRGQGVIAIESFKEKTFSEPTETQKECTLAYNGMLAEADRWVVISGEAKFSYRDGKRTELVERVSNG